MGLLIGFPRRPEGDLWGDGLRESAVQDETLGSLRTGIGTRIGTRITRPSVIWSLAGFLLGLLLLPPVAAAGAAPPLVAADSWDAVFEARRDWWSFKPVRKPSVPLVKDLAWSGHPVDRFLLARMEERGLGPTVPAGRRVLIRRLSLALIGLPPTPDEVRAFLEDNSPDAYARVVDRLLASPRFGE